MKDILKQIAWVFIALVCCVIQLVALVFAGLAWVFGNLSALLDEFSGTVMEKYPSEKKEDISEEAPVDGVNTEGDLA